MKIRPLMAALWFLGYLPPLFLFLERPYAKSPHARTVMTVTAVLLVVFTTAWNTMIYRRELRRQRLLAEIRSRGYYEL